MRTTRATSALSLWIGLAGLGCSPDAGAPPDAGGPEVAGRPATQGLTDEAEGVIARVGETRITRADLEAAEAGPLGRSRGRAPRRGAYRGLLQRRIDLLLVEQEAVARGIPSDPEFVAQRDAIRQRADDRIRELMRARILEQLAAEAEVSDAELQERMQQMPRRFQRRQLHLRLLAVDDQAAAVAAAERIAKGESFAEVAAEVSTDPELRSSGGDLGPRGRAELPPGIGGRARALRTPGEVSEPFRANGRWNLIQLVAPPVDVTPPFEELRPELERELRAVKAAQALPELLAARRVEVGVAIDEERLAELVPDEPSPRSLPPPERRAFPRPRVSPPSPARAVPPAPGLE